MNIDKLKAELVRDKGRVLTPYRDTFGNMTVGVGHLIGPDGPVGAITDSACDDLLNDDVATAMNRLQFIYPAYKKLDEVRQRALVNMVFDLGYKLGGFVLFMRALDMRDWPEAGRQLEKSAWGKQVGDRAVRIRHMIETGQEHLS